MPLCCEMQTIGVYVCASMQVCLVSSFVRAFLASTFQHFFISVSVSTSLWLHFFRENIQRRMKRRSEFLLSDIVYTYACLYHYLWCSLQCHFSSAMFHFVCCKRERASECMCGTMRTQIYIYAHTHIRTHTQIAFQRSFFRWNEKGSTTNSHQRHFYVE